MTSRNKSKVNIKHFSIMLLIVAGVSFVFVNRDLFSVNVIEDWVQQAGGAGPLLFILVYALAAVFFLPGSILTLAGGALFGPVFGTLLNIVGATLGASIAFLIARYLGGDWVEKKTAGRLKQLKEGVEEEGWRFIVFVRLVPLFPFNLLNYAFGLTRIKLSHYVLASFFGMFPGAIAYTYLGYVGREAAAGAEGLVQKIMLAMILLALVAFVPRFIAKFREKTIECQ
ncbi:MAG: TVP38/TMEM64 family protein [Gammaproteobacteria bacterium]|nr:TVP38/TMEM64 family protein [Gammaproteobacteria bacterium]